MKFSDNINNIFSLVFSEKNIKKTEKYILYIASLGFILHLILILLNYYNIIEISFGDSNLLTNPISALYTPFSFILIYEAFLLVYYIPRSFSTAISKQYEIMSLIIIRKIFKDIPLVDLNANWLTTSNNLQLIYDLLGILIVFFLIYLFKKIRKKSPKKFNSKKLDLFIASKKIISLLLTPILIIVCCLSFYSWLIGIGDETAISENINYLFFTDFFTLLILADVFILLLSFQYTERYCQIIRNTGFIISTILLRLSFSTNGLSSILLIISGIIFGLLILYIYNLIAEEDLG
ncbi:MAG: hypothetical protein ACKVLD_03985 [Flavobacteriales bacterium]|jgi:hypothetical protein|tara:strand:+ start:1791 stop:2666 length:876 start_codon:yes stop_codon:yes gene_type:complete